MSNTEIKKPKRKASTNEWVVRVFVNGRNDESQAYYTNDKKDADDTYRHMINRNK